MTESPFINEVATYFPNQVVSNAELEERFNLNGVSIPNGILARLFGCNERRFAGLNQQVSDLAVNAVKNLTMSISDVDLLIFAAASSDLIEPATSNIIQSKLGLSCATMDIKNACNSMTTSIIVASSFIQQQLYKKVLIVNGEKLSEVINYNAKDEKHMMKIISGCTLGDAGCAMLLSKEQRGFKIINQEMMSWGQYWNVCTVLGGGSMHFRDESKFYFEVDSKNLKAALSKHGYSFTIEQLNKCQWSIEDIKLFLTHQVSSNTALMVAKNLGIEADKVHQIFKAYGNIAAATVPATLADFSATKKMAKGDKILMVGLAAGINVSVHCLEYYN